MTLSQHIGLGLDGARHYQEDHNASSEIDLAAGLGAANLCWARLVCYQSCAFCFRGYLLLEMMHIRLVTGCVSPSTFHVITS